MARTDTRNRRRCEQLTKIRLNTVATLGINFLNISRELTTDKNAAARNSRDFQLLYFVLHLQRMKATRYTAEFYQPSAPSKLRTIISFTGRDSRSVCLSFRAQAKILHQAHSRCSFFHQKHTLLHTTHCAPLPCFVKTSHPSTPPSLNLPLRLQRTSCKDCKTPARSCREDGDKSSRSNQTVEGIPPARV